MGAAATLRPSAVLGHPQAVSFSEMHHRPAKRCIECAMQAKAEDLEHVARSMSGLSLRFDGKGFEAWIVAYLRRVMVLRGPQGQDLVPLQWVGHDTHQASLWLYVQLPTTVRWGAGEPSPELADDLHGYHLCQGYMLGVVPYQVNTVVLHRGGARQTLHYMEDSPRFLRLPEPSAKAPAPGM